MFRKMKLLLGLTAVIGLTAIATSLAVGGQSNPSKPGLSPSDYNEISQLYGLYAVAVDPGSPRDASWLFTKDGTFEVPALSLVVQGREDLKAFYEGVRTSQSVGIRHFNTTYLMVKTPEGARASGFLLIVTRSTADGPWTISGVGVYEDRLVETRDGWRIKKRIFRSDTYTGDPNPFPTAPIG